ncbi:MAG TPA: VOC family protein [Leptospiraceae bacterium]|nr:VOC family protein [Leptospiraceae bacterium]HMW04252.1 VOC family protein [Leptospiraceae bacterium]HMX30598.1 VOC family protein [Leptospiraceae bacterium]HMY31298.1 VOC family protein [Leptospiraceae bacterium]HMZ63411.1 VOC family protein [Leptospiraceae bacterium]
MAKVSIYLNFQGNTKEAFDFYKSIFGTDFETIVYHKDTAENGRPNLPENEWNKIMHIDLPILGGIHLMGSDMLESMGHSLKIGNNTTINLQGDTLAETKRLFESLSNGASEIAPFGETPWGHWGCLLDKFGIRWMFIFPL